jgi:hypothetical protein
LFIKLPAEKSLKQGTAAKLIMVSSLRAHCGQHSSLTAQNEKIAATENHRHNQSKETAENFARVSFD